MQVLDGKGRGYNAEVNSDNQLSTRAVSISALHQASLNGEAFAWNAVTYDPDAADTLLLVRNDSSTKYLVIDKIYVRCDTATAVDVHLVTANFTAAGTAVTGVCLNKASATVADATAKADETGNTQGDIILTAYLHLAVNAQATTSVAQMIDLEGAVILGDDQAIGVDLVTASTAAECTIIGHYIDK
jgi:hypothetical protein